MEQLHGVLLSSEVDLIRETEPHRMALLNEDELLALHKRIRRARNKHVSNYRRQGSAGVEKHGGRGKSRPKNRDAAEKAEVFEEALAGVSSRLAEVAHRAAADIKAARLATAKPAGGSGPASPPSQAESGVGNGASRAHRQTEGGRKRDASSRAMGAKRQAKRDAR